MRGRQTPSCTISNVFRTTVLASLEFPRRRDLLHSNRSVRPHSSVKQTLFWRVELEPSIFTLLFPSKPSHFVINLPTAPRAFSKTCQARLARWPNGTQTNAPSSEWPGVPCSDGLPPAVSSLKSQPTSLIWSILAWTDFSRRQDLRTSSRKTFSVRKCAGLEPSGGKVRRITRMYCSGCDREALWNLLRSCSAGPQLEGSGSCEWRIERSFLRILGRFIWRWLWMSGAVSLRDMVVFSIGIRRTSKVLCYGSCYEQTLETLKSMNTLHFTGIEFGRVWAKNTRFGGFNSIVREGSTSHA